MSEPGPGADMQYGRAEARTHPRWTQERAGRWECSVTVSGSRAYAEDRA